MTTKTRFFLFASALVVVVGLGTGLLAYYGGLPTMASSRSAPDELKYVPANASMVAYANVREVMASEFRHSLRQIMPHQGEEGQNKFEQETGIDVEQDIDHVVAYMTPEPKDGQKGPHASGMVMMRGRFDNGRLEAIARQHGAQSVDIGGVRVLRLDADGKPEASRALLGFVEPGLIIFGEEDAVRRSLSKADANVTTNAEVMAMIGDLDGEANMWAVGRVDALADSGKLPEQVRAQIPPVKWFTASSRVNGGLTGTLRAEARDDTAAENLKQMVQGFVAMARLQAGNKPELQQMIQSLQVSGSGRTVALSFQVPGDFIEALSQQHSKSLPNHP